jgi:hypothetical protein
MTSLYPRAVAKSSLNAAYLAHRTADAHRTAHDGDDDDRAREFARAERVDARVDATHGAYRCRAKDDDVGENTKRFSVSTDDDAGECGRGRADVYEDFRCHHRAGR